MQDDEEFSRKYTHEELENTKELARNLYSTTDAAAIGKFVDLSSRQAEVMQDVITKLAAVTAQRDELIDELDTTKKALAMAVNTGPDSLLELAKKDIGYYMTEAVKTVIAQRDELLQTVKAVQTMCHGAIRVRIDGIIAKCEAQNDER